jgi:hypothetical protein
VQRRKALLGCWLTRVRTLDILGLAEHSVLSLLLRRLRSGQLQQTQSAEKDSREEARKAYQGRTRDRDCQVLMKHRLGP